MTYEEHIRKMTEEFSREAVRQMFSEGAELLKFQISIGKPAESDGSEFWNMLTSYEQDIICKSLTDRYTVPVTATAKLMLGNETHDFTFDFTFVAVQFLIEFLAPVTIEAREDSAVLGNGTFARVGESKTEFKMSFVPAVDLEDDCVGAIDEEYPDRLVP